MLNDEWITVITIYIARYTSLINLLTNCINAELAPVNQEFLDVTYFFTNFYFCKSFDTRQYIRRNVSFMITSVEKITKYKCNYILCTKTFDRRRCFGQILNTVWYT